MHIQQTPDTITRSSGTIPQPSKQAVVLPPPKAIAPLPIYNFQFLDGVTLKEALFAISRDAQVNLDFKDPQAPEMLQPITLNVVGQTFPQIIDRLAKQTRVRFEYDAKGNLLVSPDTPYLKHYPIDYVNITRDADGDISNTSQVGSTSGTTAGNNSKLSIKNSSKNHFWETLVGNIKDILRESDKDVLVGGTNCGNKAISSLANEQEASATGSGKAAVQSASVIEGAGAGGEGNQRISGRTASGQKSEQQSDCSNYYTQQAATVMSNPEAGFITVRADSKQHQKIQEFITKVMRSARRQVLIEATIAEVRLSSNYQQGIDWQRLRLGAKGFGLKQVGTPGLGSTNTGSMMVLDYLNPTSKLGNLSASVSLLDSFGDVKVLSSPKLSVMNNQTAMLRVVDNLVYFTIKADTTTNQTTSITTYTTTPITVPTGFTMSVTPQINDSDTVLLNLRPSITRLLGYVNDPNPALAAAGVTSRIPQLQTREMESMLKIENNQIAILGGLMQDEINNLTDGIPLLDSIPFAGNAFKNRNDTKTKTELVIFLRPVVIKDGSIDGDFVGFRDSLPTSDFLKPESEKE
ncbi:MAG: type II and III secretion system protein [Pseudomonadota bacterium]